MPEITTTAALREALQSGQAAASLVLKPADVPPAEATAAHHEAAATVIADAVTAERSRIDAIQKLTREGFDALTAKALKDGLSTAAFAVELLNEIRDRGITIDAIKKGSPPPASSAGQRQENDPGAEASSLMVAAMRELNQQTAR